MLLAEISLTRRGRNQTGKRPHRGEAETLRLAQRPMPRTGTVLGAKSEPIEFTGDERFHFLERGAKLGDATTVEFAMRLDSYVLFLDML